MYKVTKRFGHEEGLSCAFRQHRATSHCNLLHGYALAFEFDVCSPKLDRCNWAFDFGGFKELRAKLHAQFDHTTVIAADDPELEFFLEAQRKNLIDLRVMPQVGCEAFSQWAFERAHQMVIQHNMDAKNPHPYLTAVRVSEHGGNTVEYDGGRLS